MDSLIDFLKEFYEVLYYGLGIAEMGVSGVVLVGGIIVTVISAIFNFVVSVLIFIIEATPLYKVSKKMNRKYAWMVWLSWIPIIGKYFCTFVVADIPGDKPVRLFKKIQIESRVMSFCIHTGIGIFGTALVTVIVGIANVIPVVGQAIGAFSTLFYLIPAIATAWIEYAYMRDILDIFKPNKKSNNITAIVIAALDGLATMGIARAVYMYTIMNKEPLFQVTEAEQTAYAESVIDAEIVEI